MAGFGLKRGRRTETVKAIGEKGERMGREIEEEKVDYFYSAVFLRYVF